MNTVEYNVGNESFSTFSHHQQHAIDTLVYLWWLCCFLPLFSKATNRQNCLALTPQKLYPFDARCCIWTLIFKPLTFLICWLLIGWCKLGKFLQKHYLSIPFRLTMIKPSGDWTATNFGISKAVNQSFSTHLVPLHFNIVGIVCIHWEAKERVRKGQRQKLTSLVHLSSVYEWTTCDCPSFPWIHSLVVVLNMSKTALYHSFVAKTSQISYSCVSMPPTNAIRHQIFVWQEVVSCLLYCHQMWRIHEMQPMQSLCGCGECAQEIGWCKTTTTMMSVHVPRCVGKMVSAVGVCCLATGWWVVANEMVRFSMSPKLVAQVFVHHFPPFSSVKPHLTNQPMWFHVLMLPHAIAFW